MKDPSLTPLCNMLTVSPLDSKAIIKWKLLFSSVEQIEICIIFWHNRDLRVMFDLYASDLNLLYYFIGPITKKKYYPVLFGKSAVYTSKYTLEPLLSQSMVHFTPITKSGSKY